MAHAKRHAGGQPTRLYQRFTGDHPNATPRTASIRSYIERQVAERGLAPGIEDVARAFAMSPAKVERHYRILGLL